MQTKKYIIIINDDVIMTSYLPSTDREYFLATLAVVDVFVILPDTLLHQGAHLLHVSSLLLRAREGGEREREAGRRDGE